MFEQKNIELLNEQNAVELKTEITQHVLKIQ
jgi:hypothetical protein